MVGGKSVRSSDEASNVRERGGTQTILGEYIVRGKSQAFR